MLRILSSKKKTAFYNSFKNSEQEVLFEIEQKNNRIYGYSRNYLRVSVPYQSELINQKRKNAAFIFCFTINLHAFNFYDAIGCVIQ